MYYQHSRYNSFIRFTVVLPRLTLIFTVSGSIFLFGSLIKFGSKNFWKNKISHERDLNHVSLAQT